MKITYYYMERLTPRTRELNEASEGFGCNKTIFLLQEHMQMGNSEDTETWTIMHYERDRLGLLNGLIYLMKTRNLQYFEAFFPGNDNHESYFFRFNKEMSFTEISTEIDILYMSILVEYK